MRRIQQHREKAVRRISVALGTLLRHLLPGSCGILHLLAQRHLHHVFQGVAVQDVGHGIAHVDHQHAQSAVRFIGTGAGFILRLTGATDGRQLAVDQTNHVPHADGVHGPGQARAAVLAAQALHITRCLELKQNGLKEFERQMLLLGQTGDGDHAFVIPRGHAETDQGSQGVFTAFGQLHIRRPQYECYPHLVNRDLRGA